MTNGAPYQRRFEQMILGVITLSTILLYGTALFFPTPRPAAFTHFSFPWTGEVLLESVSFLSFSTIAPHISATVPEQLSARTLQTIFEQIDYSLEAVASGAGQVPQLHLSALPGDLRHISDAGIRKDLFLRLMLPLILQVNDEILAERRRLVMLRRRVKQDLLLLWKDTEWLANRLAYYRVPISEDSASEDIDALLLRVNIIPPSLALAQAALESGWGTSRLARRRNVLFGQTTVGDDPQAIASRGFSRRIIYYKTFTTPTDAVREYVRNLNSHPAYEDFRRARAQRQAKGAPLRGEVLVETLENYAEMTTYARRLQRVIRSSDLGNLDEAILAANDYVLRF